jgi:AcrR family transcriptional regulator
LHDEIIRMKSSGSTINSIKKQYHHGNLSESLVAEAITLLEQHGLAALSLRRVAKQAGVSQAAPYGHFKDKKALLTAVANEGFSRFAIRVQEEAAKLTDSERVIGLGRGYVLFALENPALFHLMFSGESSEFIDAVDIKDGFGAGYQALVSALTLHPIERGGKASNIQLDTAFAWSLVHGIANLLLAKTFTPELYGYADVDSFVTDLLQRHLLR